MACKKYQSHRHLDGPVEKKCSGTFDSTSMLWVTGKGEVGEEFIPAVHVIIVLEVRKVGINV